MIVYQMTYKNANRNSHKICSDVKVKIAMKEINKFSYCCMWNG